MESSGEAWIVEYTRPQRKRHIKSFDRKKDADAYHAVGAGRCSSAAHTCADSKSVTVAEAGGSGWRAVMPPVWSGQPSQLSPTPRFHMCPCSVP